MRSRRRWTCRCSPSGSTGELRDRSTGQPIPKALVQVYTVTAPLTQAVPALLRSDAEGRFALQDASAVTALAVKAPGYRRVTVPVTETGRLRIELQPFEARAIYVPFGLLTLPKVIDDLLKLVEESDSTRWWWMSRATAPAWPGAAPSPWPRSRALT